MFLILVFFFHYVLYKLFDYFIISKYRKYTYKINESTIILITGGCSGIGKQTILNFVSKKKCTVIVYDIQENLSQKLLEEIESFGGKGFFYKCDLSNREQLEKTLNLTLEKFPKIDILINNAGIVAGKSVLDVKMQEIERVLDVNLFAPIYITKKLLPKMIENKKGHIVNICSVAHVFPGINLAEYSASKGALYNYFYSLRLELKKDNLPIDTTIINPHVINTGMFKGFNMKLASIFPCLNEKEVGEIIYETILCKKEVAYIPWYYGNIWTLFQLIPNFLFEKLILFIEKDSMSNFVGRDKKSN